MTALDRLTGELLPSTLIGVLSLGLGTLFLLLERKSRATLAQAVAFLAFGLGALFLPYYANRAGADLSLAMRLNCGAEFLFMLAAAWYAYALLETSHADERARRRVRSLLNLLVVEASVLFVIGVAFPRQRTDDYLFGFDDPDSFTRPGFWLFAVPWAAVSLTFGLAWLLLWRNGLDEGERARAASMAAAIPFLIGTTVAPYDVSIWLALVAVVIILNGVLRYYVVAGERSAFLSRFLSPQVSELVDARGLAEVMKPHEVELTVVACDLRGFTAYAEAVPSQSVIDLLAEYYDAVGNAVAEHGGTIKDYAGDGVLVLVGAPLPREDHAMAGLDLARRVRNAVSTVTDRWSTEVHPLGVGVGVASGKVTVGAIGSAGRMEYTAVGTAVNLAARLCASAIDGEILASQPAVQLANAADVDERGAIQLKGLSAEQQIYAVSVSPDPEGRQSWSS